jgi:hypothetical protein
MSSIVNAALQLRFQHEPLPPWVEPFMNAAEALKPLDQKDEKEKQKRRQEQGTGDIQRKKMGEVVVPVQSDEEEILGEISLLERAVEELQRVSLIPLVPCRATNNQ